MKYFILLIIILSITIIGCSRVDDVTNGNTTNSLSNKQFLDTHNYIYAVDSLDKMNVDNFKTLLTPYEYSIVVDKGTERPFTGDLLHNEKRGVYVTAGCGLPVFSSETKFDSGTGWPSFYDVLNSSNIILEEDYKLGYKRTEILSKCGEHLGHVFDDGPEPTGLRYCINSAALDFVEEQ